MITSLNLQICIYQLYAWEQPFFKQSIIKYLTALESHSRSMQPHVFIVYEYQKQRFAQQMRRASVCLTGRWDAGAGR